MQPSPDADLKVIYERVYVKCGLIMSKLERKPESTVYGACSFQLNDMKIEYRVSKATPTKSGQFVTIWKRSEEGIATPFDISDDIDYVVITARSGENLGQFILPKSVLLQQGIFSQSGKGGKRGIRVYPPWVVTHSRQAARTQNWQIEYFCRLQTGVVPSLDHVRDLFSHGQKNQGR